MTTRSNIPTLNIIFIFFFSIIFLIYKQVRFNNSEYTRMVFDLVKNNYRLKNIGSYILIK